MNRNIILDIWLKLMLGILVTAIVGGIIGGMVALGLRWSNEAAQNALSANQNNSSRNFEQNQAPQLPTDGYVVYFSNGDWLQFANKADAVQANKNSAHPGTIATATQFDADVQSGKIHFSPFGQWPNP